MNEIKNVQLLLSRIGSESNYDCCISLYEADIDGKPIGAPLGTCVREVESINGKSYCNFIFDPVVSTDVSDIVIVFWQTIDDGNNYVIWHRSEGTNDGDGYSIESMDGFSHYGEYYAYDYGYVYGYGYDYSGADFFDVFNVTSEDYGYGVDGETGTYGYGFETVLWKESPISERAYRIYNEFNEITFNKSLQKCYIELPAAENKTVVYDNRQDFYAGYKVNTQVNDDKVVLKDIGRRICFYDTSESEPIWRDTNRNLPAKVNDYLILPTADGNAYNCLALAATDEGLWISRNSGGDWVQESTKKALFIVPYVEDDSWFLIEQNDITPANYDLTLVSQSDGVFSFENIFQYTAVTPTLAYYDTVDRILVIYFSSGDLIVYDTTNLDIWVTKTYPSCPVTNKIYVDAATRYYYLCTDDGVYKATVSQMKSGFLGPYFNTLMAGTDAKGNVYCIEEFNSQWFVGTSEGLYIYDSTNHLLIGDDPTGAYLANINKDQVNCLLKVTKNTVGTGDDFILFVGQDSGVCKTYNGISFESCSSNLYPDINVNILAANPKDNRFIHACVRTTKNVTPYITFVVDNSGSMFSRSTTPDNDQYKLLADIGDAINAAYLETVGGAGTTPENADIPGMRFELITFATTQAEYNQYRDAKIYSNLDVDMKGAENYTHGFVPWSVPNDPDYFSDYLVSASMLPKQNYLSSLYETLWATLVGMYNDGSDWFYVDNNLQATAQNPLTANKYHFEPYEDLLFRNSYRIVIVVTDGRDNASLQTLESLISATNKYGTKNANCKFYFIAYGEHANLRVLNQLKSESSEVLVARNGNDADFTRIKNHILAQELHHTREGIYRKHFYSTDYKKFTNAVINTVIPEDTSITVTYRVSDNKYDLGDFKYLSATLTHGSNTITIDEHGKFIELQFKLSSQDPYNSPSIKSITFNYVIPSTSNLMLDSFDNDTTKRMDQFHLTANIWVYQYGYSMGYDYYHYLDQPSSPRIVDIKAKFSPTISVDPAVFEDSQIENRSIVNRRDLERTTTDDYISFTAVNGPWDNSQTVVVYVNAIEVDRNQCILRSEKGEIVFPLRLRESDVVVITIEPTTKFRIALECLNYSESPVPICLNKGAMEYSVEDSTISPREALPITPSQVPSTSSATVQVGSTVSGNASNIIAGQSGNNIYVTYFTKKQIDVNSYILFGLGEIFSISDTETQFKCHEGRWLFNTLQSTSPSSPNYVSLTSNNEGAMFEYKGITPNKLMVFKYVRGGNDRIPRNGQLYFNISKFNTGMNCISSPSYVTASGATAALETQACISTEASIEITSDDLTEIETSLLPNIQYATPNIQLSSTVESPYVNLIVPSFSSDSEIPVIINCIDSNGIFSTQYENEFLIQYQTISPDGTTGTAVQVATPVPMLPRHKGTVKKLTSLPITNNYKLSVIRKSDRLTTYSNVVRRTGNSVVWGDLNAKSSYSYGRQSPAFIFDYAKNVAGLDFCAIADLSTTLSTTDWTQLKAIADDYNVQGEFCTFVGTEWRAPSTSVGVGRRSIIFGDGNLPPITTVSACSSVIDLYGITNQYPNTLTFALNPAYSSTDTAYNSCNVNWSSLKDTTNFNYTWEKAIEVISEHGNSESVTNRNVNALKASTEATTTSYYADALWLGYKVAALGNSDGPCSRPGLYAGELNRSTTGMPKTDDTSSLITNRCLTGVITSNKNRNSIISAIIAGNTYATTGARIIVDFTLSNATMGGTVTVSENIAAGVTTISPLLEFSITVMPSGTQTVSTKLVRVVIGNADHKYDVIYTSSALQFTASDATLVTIRSDAAYYLIVTQADGHMAITSPIYVTYQRAAS